MNNVEDRLRETLRRHADAAPEGQWMLSRVHADVASRQRRYRLAAVAVTVIALVVGEVSVGLFAQSLKTQETVYSSSVLVPGSDAFVSFPFTPKRPLGDLSGPTLTLVKKAPTLTYSSASSRDLPATVTVTDGPQGGVNISGSIKVRAREGRFGVRPVADSILRVLMWQERPKEWVEIDAPNSQTINQMVEYANGLLAQPMTWPFPFTFDLVPTALVVDNASATGVSFTSANRANGGGLVDGIVVYVEPTTMGTTGGLVDVGGHHAWLSHADGSTLLQVSYSAHSVLWVQVDDGVGLSRTDLIRFVAGIHLTAAAQETVG